MPSKRRILYVLKIQGLAAGDHRGEAGARGEIRHARRKIAIQASLYEKRTSLLCAQRRHGNWNVERGAGDSHAAFASGGRVGATGTLALTTRGPEHEAEHAVCGPSPIGRDAFDEACRGLLI